MDGAEAAGFYCSDALDLRGQTLCGSPLRCVNDEAVWTLSSARPSYGVDAMLQDDVGGASAGRGRAGTRRVK